MNFKSKKRFTLIELIVVVAVIAILAAIILPNISDMTAKAMVSAIKGNARNIQTASDMYVYDFGNKATLSQPEYGIPKQFDYDKLYPNYLRNHCSDIKEYYWVDYLGNVQGSVIKPPKVNELSGDTLSWENSLNAVSYNIYIDDNGKQILYKENAISPTIVDEGEWYFVSAVDRYNFETPAVSSEYDPSSDEKNCTSSGADAPKGESVIKLGDYMVLGEYNGEPLEWVVLKNDATGLYLFNTNNTDALSSRKFSDHYTVSNWENSSIRSFLNEDFYNDAFNSYQKSIILSTNYKNYVPTSSLAEGGSEMLEFWYDWDLEKHVNNADSAYYNVTSDKVALPSVFDKDETNILKHILNLDLRTVMNNSIYTRDANGLTNMFVFTKDMYGKMYSEYFEPDIEKVIRPVMYIRHDATPTGGNGTIQSPYVFQQTSVPNRRIIKEYDDIVVTNDMFPTDVTSDSQDLGIFIKTIELDIPDEYQDEMLLLTMTLEKTHEGNLFLVHVTQDWERDYPAAFHNTILNMGKYSTMKYVPDNNLPQLSGGSTGTYEFFVEQVIQFKDLDLYVSRHSNNTQGFKLKNIKLETYK